jgi:hypothetical protein
LSLQSETSGKFRFTFFDHGTWWLLMQA